MEGPVSANGHSVAGQVELIDRRAVREPPLVWKFGGSSVADHKRLRAAAERMVAARRSGRDVVAVLSAMGKTTDELATMAHQMSACPPLRELDALLAVGESMCCALASMAVTELGEHAVSLNGAQAGIRTDGRHGDARLRGIEPARIHSALADGSIVLVTGFQGQSELGDVTTLGRGGSDASAVALAAALGARGCEIFTDVAAVFTADPRIVPDACALKRIRHAEMLEMVEAGAVVMQPRSIELAAALDVDIHLRSSFSDEPGTQIGQYRVMDMEGTPQLVGIAHRRCEHLFTAKDVDAAQVAETLSQRGIALGVLRPELSGLRFTAPGAEPAEVCAVLDAVGALVRLEEELGSVSVVSLGIARRPELAARALNVLRAAAIEPRLVATTPGRLSVLLESALVDEATRLLHAALILGPGAALGSIDEE